MPKRFNRISCVLFLLAIGASRTAAQSLGTAFTYQGLLKQSGNAANGTYDIRFKLFADAGGTTQLGSTICAENVSVTAGKVNVTVDFGAQFNGNERYLEVGFRSDSLAGNCSTGSYTTLLPRQRLTAAPYALALPGMHTQQNPTSPNIIGGYSGNSVMGGIVGATMAGGGAAGGTRLCTNDPGIVCTADADCPSAGPCVLNPSGTCSNAPAIPCDEPADCPGGICVPNEPIGTCSGDPLMSCVDDSGCTLGVCLPAQAPNQITGDFATIGGGYGNFADGEVGLRGAGAARGKGSTIAGGAENTAKGYFSTIGGGAKNHSDADWGTIAGGRLNKVTDQWGAIGGGQNNQAGDDAGTRLDAVYATVCGGEGNKAEGSHDTIGGGLGNRAQGKFATVGGGVLNTADSLSFVGGGFRNNASSYSVIAGGSDNHATESDSFVGGGHHNTADGGASTVGGGAGNSATGGTSSIGGGGFNTASGDASTVAGGTNNTSSGDKSSIGGGEENISGSVCAGGLRVGNACRVDADCPDSTCVVVTHDVVSGGRNNTASGTRSTVGGGAENKARAPESTVAGGFRNTASGDSSAVCGGLKNTAGNVCAAGDNAGLPCQFADECPGSVCVNVSNATVGGGEMNTARGDNTTIAGGKENQAHGAYSSVPGGSLNSAGGDYSLAAGRRAKVRTAAQAGNATGDQGTFVWADATNAEFTSTGPNQFLIRASGGVGIGTPSPAHPLHMASGAHCTAGGVWTNASDRNSKQSFELLDRQRILEKVAELPVTQWQYKGEPENVRHVGPVAQDFFAAFGLGGDERYIGTIDADGIALAAIQGLHDLVREQECDIQELATRNAELDRRNAELEKRLARIEASLNDNRSSRAGGEK